MDLAKRNSEAIGFIPRPRLEQYAEAGQLLVETENGWPAGFLVVGGGWPVAKVYQACVEFDARRRANGLRLVARAVRLALARGCHAVTLWCADDLEANEFWRAAGFMFVRQRVGGRRRGRKHNLWMLRVSGPLLRAPAEPPKGEPKESA